MDKRKMAVGYRIFGIVQGVGFRPYVARLAEKHKIFGYVKNCGGYVELCAEGDGLRSFLHDLFAFSGIISKEEFEIEDFFYQDFKIIESTEGNKLPPMLTPDLPVCHACAEELFSQNSRRYHHPFISCAECGARYSIIEKIPYDRERTTMDKFPLCNKCEEEYNDLSDRRHFAQTQCCNECGPRMFFGDLNDEAAINEAVKELKAGKVIAIKGVGGYHLAADPFSFPAVEKLRIIKNRDKKPFAVMMRNVETAEKYCKIDEDERKLLESLPHPIVLLDKKESKISSLVSGDSERLGVFLPYTGYQHLILAQMGALVLTSANISDEPIIISDEKAKKLNCDGILWHNREILTPLDDSVTSIVEKTPIIHRRARGYVPLALQSDVKGEIFAAGGDLKATFGLSQGGNLYLSQYLGDLEHIGNEKRYKKEIERMCRLFEITPKKAVCDLHPGYISARICESLSLPTIKIQHHYAHTLSVMAENKLESAIGISFDGTGYGTDGNIWGSEFIYATRNDFKRLGHLQEFTLLGGEDFAKDSKKTAICALISAGKEENLLRDSRFDIIRAAMHNKINTVTTTSAGRLFDAVASILGICDRNDYEGRCGEMLCDAARRGTYAKAISMPIKVSDGRFIIKTDRIWDELLESKDKCASSYAFHKGLADAVVNGAATAREITGENRVCLSGGVFQNGLLLSLTVSSLRERGFKVYFNKLYPLGDGNIALGQLYYKENK